jgi:hypothetical protein
MTTREALKGLTRKQLEELRDEIDAELVQCAACGNEGAKPMRVHSPFLKGVYAAIPFCLPCFEKHRLPIGRAVEASA